MNWTQILSITILLGLLPLTTLSKQDMRHTQIRCVDRTGLPLRTDRGRP